MTRRALPLLLATLLMLLGGCAVTGPRSGAPRIGPGDVPTRLAEATVVLLHRNGRAYCTGALTHQQNLVLTAAHCIGKKQRTAHVRLSDGRRVTVRVLGIERQRDLALLEAPVMLGLRPLPIGASTQAVPGVKMWFLGQPKPRRPVQVARVKKRGKCKRLPSVSAVIYGSYRGFPGDSGAPLVTGEGIVGVVSGGSNCQMAIPSEEALRLLHSGLEGS